MRNLKFVKPVLIFLGAVALFRFCSTGLYNEEFAKTHNSDRTISARYSSLKDVPTLPSQGDATITIGNAAPANLRVVFRVSDAEKYRVDVPSCPTCKSYVRETPQGCPAETVDQTYAIPSGTYNVEVYFDEPNSRSFSDKLTVSTGENPGHCFFLVMNPNEEGQLE